MSVCVCVCLMLSAKLADDKWESIMAIWTACNTLNQLASKFYVIDRNNSNLFPTSTDKRNEWIKDKEHNYYYDDIKMEIFCFSSEFSILLLK